jgi:4-hydroxy-tetrahydrodipicolinate reductase
MVAEALGWELDRIEESVEPILAEHPVETDFYTVASGAVAGINQTVEGISGGETLITLDLSMFVGAENPRDVVKFQGKPDIDVVVEGGYHGDIATAAIVTNVVPSVRRAESGLQSMLDIPLPSFSRRL